MAVITKQMIKNPNLLTSLLTGLPGFTSGHNYGIWLGGSTQLLGKWTFVSGQTVPQELISLMSYDEGGFNILFVICL